MVAFEKLLDRWDFTAGSSRGSALEPSGSSRMAALVVAADDGMVRLLEVAGQALGKESVKLSELAFVMRCKGVPPGIQKFVRAAGDVTDLVCAPLLAPSCPT